MLTLNESEKSRGVIVFAFNTKVDYVGIADETSKLIRHNLNLPVTLVTDLDSVPKFAYDKIIRIDNKDTSNFRRTANNETIVWRNVGRYLAYELSPYDETILLDTDYLVLDDNLLKLFETEFDYKLMHVNQTPDGITVDIMGETSLPFIWATVLLFRKSNKAKLLFGLVSRIERNYNYYRQLYNIREGNYRNDYAFAIANNILNGYSINSNQSIPWPMLSLFRTLNSIKFENNFLKVSHDNTATVIAKQNVHILDKTYLQTDNFKELVRIICES